jgi:molybdopterin converting factor subunit 1
LRSAQRVKLGKATEMRVKLLYFAAVRDLRGLSEEWLDLPESVRDITQLLDHLQAIHPAFRGRLASVRVALNEVFAETSEALTENDIIAIIPPVAGG